MAEKIRQSRGVADIAGVAVRPVVEICIDISAVLSATDLRFRLRQLGWIDAPHTQNFEIYRANSVVKKN
jgi:hypothetical protein